MQCGTISAVKLGETAELRQLRGKTEVYELGKRVKTLNASYLSEANQVETDTFGDICTGDEVVMNFECVSQLCSVV